MPCRPGGGIPGGYQVQTEDMTSNNQNVNRDTLDYKQLGRKAAHINLKSFLDNLERNVTHIFTLQECFGADDVDL